jgi:hypothetical protein
MANDQDVRIAGSCQHVGHPFERRQERRRIATLPGSNATSSLIVTRSRLLATR